MSLNQEAAQTLEVITDTNSTLAYPQKFANALGSIVIDPCVGFVFDGDGAIKEVCDRKWRECSYQRCKNNEECQLPFGD